MHHYAILANPGHNRIYFDTALKIAVLELEAMFAGLNVQVQDIGERELGLPAAIAFSTQDPLSSDELRQISASSIYYAIFEVMPQGLLKPLQPEPYGTFPESMNQILRYTGKTNEQFTRLMVNLGLSACDTDSKVKTLMDPMCGKGTTLYEGLIRGLDVVGVEINDKWVQEIQTFIVKYLKNGRYKHETKKEKRTGEKGKKLANCFIVDTAISKEAFKAAPQNLKLMAADTRICDKVVKKNSIDLMVSDLPYGVQHGSKQATDVKMARSPLELLEEALPAWKNCLKRGGAVVLSYNEFTLKWKEAAQAFEAAGFLVKADTPYVGFVHRVDQSINRNIIVAVKG
ncbi:TRM11 family methyltransferase [Paraferrimonas sp. SM1919]|uniref:TRM11 family SAM-dependent methyltransferase n=1 Tax=Paraferrimonas sp. SM1919 TaxID=2662263 RepID=UPI0013CFD4E1|nr:DNA methylase [Paraferrimonas sp. SM1919]